MTRFNKLLLSTLTLMVLSLGSAGIAQADPLILTVNNPVATVTPGGSVTILVTAFNSGAPSIV
jgi:hypothetical protein